MEFKYRVSVIIPIYNSEKYLEWCVKSVLQDQGPAKDYEVLLVDDGSTDRSPQICDSFAAAYTNVKVIHKQNEKLSATRNRGMREAGGKYFCFLDSDDAFLPGTINRVADFFDRHYDEVDIVTFPQVDILRNGKLCRHYRYAEMAGAGVYDLNLNPYITQTRINVFAKNKGAENNIYFDTTPGFRHEDSCYNSYMLKEKLKIGYCTDGGYVYALTNDNITATYFYSYYIFESSMDYYEKLFDSFTPGEIPQYFQALVLNDISWKFRGTKLLPYHYKKEELEKAKERVIRLLQRMDDEVILKLPGVDLYHRYYFLKRKYGKKACVLADSRTVALVAGGQILASWTKLEINLQRIVTEKNQITIFGAAKSPVCVFSDVNVWVQINGDPATLRRLETSDSTYSYNRAKEKVADFRRFIETWDMDQIHTLQFFCGINENIYPVRLTNTMNSPFKNNLTRILKGDYLISYQDGTFSFEKLDHQGISSFRKWQDLFFRHLVVQLKKKLRSDLEEREKEVQAIEELKKNTNLFDKMNITEEIAMPDESVYDSYYQMRCRYLNQSEPERKIWLYNDANTNIENGLLQFRHDREKNDGIDRYYIYDNELEKIRSCFLEEELKYLVQFGSQKHKDLFMQASVILTAYAQRNYYCPFKDKEIAFVQDLWDYRVVYLQHGILHATLPWQYGNDRNALDKIVISSYFEKENMIKKYCFREEELITAGMARFDYIDRNAKPKNRILIAPSWRHYLIGDIKDNRWTPQEAKFLKSEYYQQYDALFHDGRFLRMLEDADLYVDFKLHPIFECYKGLFETGSNRICLAESAVNLSDYKICITDFSSFVFDFVYCGKPVLYFMPDYDKFCSGMHTYRELDIPLENGFGKLAVTVDEIIENIQELIDEGYRVPMQYRDFSETFFTQYGNHAEGTYQELRRCYISEKAPDGGHE